MQLSSTICRPYRLHCQFPPAQHLPANCPKNPQHLYHSKYTHHTSKQHYRHAVTATVIIITAMVTRCHKGTQHSWYCMAVDLLKIDFCKFFIKKEIKEKIRCALTSHHMVCTCKVKNSGLFVDPEHLRCKKIDFFVFFWKNTEN